jgi:hypothetical protein
MEDQFLNHHCNGSCAFGIDRTTCVSFEISKGRNDLQQLGFCSSVGNYCHLEHDYRPESHGVIADTLCCMDLEPVVIPDRSSEDNHVHGCCFGERMARPAHHNALG